MLSLILLSLAAWALLVAGAATNEYAAIARDLGNTPAAREAAVDAVLSAGLGLSLMAAGWWLA